MFTSKISSQFGMLALLCDMRFVVYFVYEGGSIQYDLLWDFNFRFDPLLKALGKHTYLDFNLQQDTMITCTMLGYICIFQTKNKCLVNTQQVLDPKTQKPFNFSILYHVSENRFFVGYSLYT